MRGLDVKGKDFARAGEKPCYTCMEGKRARGAFDESSSQAKEHLE